MRKMFMTGALVLVLAGAVATSAQAYDPDRNPPAAAWGDVVAHTGRSYLDPGASTRVGSGDHYFSDTAHYGQQGPDFTRNTAGSELLSGRFAPN
jgi:hypothetical protein